MHNLKEIRKNFDDFKNALKGRFLKIDFNELKDLDIKNRNFIQKKEHPKMLFSILINLLQLRCCISISRSTCTC